MEVKILIKRKVKKEIYPQLTPLLLELRAMAVRQHGYISGETIVSAKDTEDCLVISSWRSFQDWEHWLASEERQAVQDEIDTMIGSKTEYEVYYSGR
jgi:heme-degrading monooxygenase HmoA